MFDYMYMYLRMAYKDSAYIIMIAVVRVDPNCSFGADTHLGGGVMTAFVFVYWTLASTFVGSTALRTGPWRIWAL